MKILRTQSRWHIKDMPKDRNIIRLEGKRHKFQLANMLLDDYYNDCFITAGSEDIIDGSYLLKTELHVDNYVPKFYEPADMVQRVETLERRGVIDSDIASYILGGKAR